MFYWEGTKPIRRRLQSPRPMTFHPVRLRLIIVMLAWLAQAFMPVAHATTMAGAKTAGGVWCGEPASAMAALAALPAELRAALDESDAASDHLENCTLLCAVGIATPPPIDVAPTIVLRAAGLEPALVPLSRPTARAQAPTPPAQAPPSLG
jgi:hypothetical protein